MVNNPLFQVCRSNRFFFTVSLFILIKKTLQGPQALQPNNNTKLIIKKTILKNKQNYTIYDDINGTSFGDMIIII